MEVKLIITYWESDLRGEKDTTVNDDVYYDVIITCITHVMLHVV